MKKSKFFMLLMLLNYFSSIKTKLNDGENQAIEFEIGSTVEYDVDKNYFKFDYFGPTGLTIYFGIPVDANIHFTAPNGIKIKLDVNQYSKYRVYDAILDYNGTYYINIECTSFDCITGSKFTSFIPGKVMDTIDFTKNYYLNDIAFKTNLSDSCFIYKVRKLSEEKYVYFSLLKEYYNYYTFYPDEPIYSTDIVQNSTIFEVCNDENDICQRNVKIYYFEKNIEYTIKTHILKESTNLNTNDDSYLFPQYIFFPITKDNFKYISSDDSGILLVDRPIFYIADKHFKNKKYFEGYVFIKDIEDPFFFILFLNQMI